MRKIKELFKILVFVLICQGAGIIGSFFTYPAISGWYANLEKPIFSPPNWVFGPAWLTLYTLMGISLYLVWKKRGEGKAVKTALSFFFIQLLLNTFWSILFFGLRSPLLAFIEIIILWFFILLTIISFYKISKKASFLLLPYILWVSFAAILNLFVHLLN